MTEISRDLLDETRELGPLRSRAADFFSKLLAKERDTILWREEVTPEENVDNVGSALDSRFLRDRVHSATDTASSIYFNH